MSVANAVKSRASFANRCQDFDVFKCIFQLVILFTEKHTYPSHSESS